MFGTTGAEAIDQEPVVFELEKYEATRNTYDTPFVNELYVYEFVVEFVETLLPQVLPPLVEACTR